MPFRFVSWAYVLRHRKASWGYTRLILPEWPQEANLPGMLGFLGLPREGEGRKIRLKRPSEETPKSKRTIEISLSGLFVELSQDLLGLSKAYLRFPYMAPPKAHWVTSLLGNASPKGTLDFWGGPRRPKVNQGNPKMGQDYFKMAPS